MSGSDPAYRRLELLDGWQRAAIGWGRRADRVREFGMPVSRWMIEQLQLAPGQRVLELAAGPGDTGFMSAELITPGGTLVCSDGVEAMLEVARARAAMLGIENVEFKRLELEWIDLPAASVNAALCRWGFMLSVDPAAALRETRRVLAPGGRLALAVWDAAEHNPWATVAGRALVKLGHSSAPDPSGPGMFALARRERLQELLQDAGLLEPVLESVDVGREYASLDEYLDETVDLSRSFAEVFNGLSSQQRVEVRSEIASLSEPFTLEDGTVRFPGRSLVAAASA